MRRSEVSVSCPDRGTTKPFRQRPGWRVALSRALDDRRGAIAPVIAAFMPVALGLAGAVVDISHSFVEQNRLQTAVDEAALVAAGQLPDEAAARSTAARLVNRQFQEDDRFAPVLPADVTVGRWDADKREIRPTRSGEALPDSVAIDIRRRAADGTGLDTFFLKAIGINQLDLGATAVAQAVPVEPPTCIYLLDPTAGGALSVVGTADIVAPDCRISVASSAANAVAATGNAAITAKQICAAGGVQRIGVSRITVEVEEACDPSGDPLAHVSPPDIGACTHYNRSVSGSAVLQPGVYCGGLTIVGSGLVTLAPGIFVINDGPLTVSGSGRLVGDGVAIHLAGNDARLHFSGSRAIELKAPRTGPLAGFVYYQNRNVPDGLESFAAGASQARYEGTLYLPRQHLRWAGTPSADLPPWTVIVARTLSIYGTGRLRLGTDYGVSEVPAPREVKGSKKTRLVN